MTCRSSRSTLPSITARASATEKAQFSALAYAAGLSESAFALQAIRAVLQPKAQIRELSPAGHAAATDRITIRLRPGDGAAVADRAARRGMKASTYVAALVRSHIVANPPMTDKEVAQLKEGLRILAAFGQRFAQTARSPALSGPAQETLRKDLETIRRLVGALETCTHKLVRASLVSWESRSGRNGP
jgi:predicted DNA binding CopG/RHH family protein